jgi:serine/threonine-protein kinase
MSGYGEEQIGRVLGGRYRLVAPVGTGASATVYQADDVQLRRRVAVKMLHPVLADDPAFLRRFRAEAQAAAGLSHPNIMAVFDWGEEQEAPYLVLEYLGGGSLRAILDRGRLLTPSQALMVGLEAARGLDYAHRRRIVHRDIKPANLLFGEDRRLRIADFGLARAIAEAAWTEPAGVLLGTARYASPEQAKGEPVDGKSDVYSLALTMVESVTGEVPFAGETTVATLMNRVDRLLPVSADLGPLASVLERAGRPYPAERSTAAEFGKALIGAAEKLPRPTPLALVATSTAPVATAATSLGRPSTAATTAGMVGAGGSAADRGAARTIEPGRPGPGTAGAAAVAAAASPTPASGPPALPPEAAGAAADLFDQDAGRPRRTLHRFLIALVVLVVAAVVGVVVVLFHDNAKPSHPISGLVGMEAGEARNRIATYGWNVDEVHQKSDAQPLGKIFRTDPASGMLAKGDRFTLYVSDGATPSVLPPLVGQKVAAVAATLARLKLPMTQGPKQFSETAPAGTVMAFTVAGQQVPAGTSVDKGSPVTVVVSAGPRPRTVPSVAGRSAAQAEQTLKALGLVPVRGATVFSPTVPVGAVAGTAPGAGASVPKGARITYYLSKGQDLVVVPPLSGLNVAQARAALAAAGLRLGTTSGDQNGPVFRATPAPGTKVPRGSAVSVLLFP